jgi:hypothetical protein
MSSSPSPVSDKSRFEALQIMSPSETDELQRTIVLKNGQRMSPLRLNQVFKDHKIDMENPPSAVIMSEEQA